MAGGKRRSGGFVLIILALLLIAALAVVYFLFLRPGISQPQAGPLPTPTVSLETVSIVVTSQPVARGTVLTEGVLTLIKFPKAEMVEGMFFTDMVQVVGKRAKMNLDARIPVTNSMVMEEKGGSLASIDIPNGMTAFSIPIAPETAVSFAPQQYDHVMVVACMLLADLDQTFQTRTPNYTAQVIAPGVGTTGTTSTVTIASGGPSSAQGRFEVDTQINQPIYVVPSEASSRPRLVCQTIIQDSTILRVGAFPINPTEQSTQATPQPTAQPQGGEAAAVVKNPPSITLIVTPQDTVILNYFLLSGAKLSLALRGAGDTTVIKTDPVTLQYIMDSKNIPQPAKLPFGLEPRVDTLSFPPIAIP